MAYVRVVADGVEVDLWVVPRSSRAALGPLEPARGCLRAAVNAPGRQERRMSRSVSWSPTRWPSPRVRSS